MTSPRIEIDLRKIRQNTQVLVNGLAAHEINVSGVTKAVCGDPAVARAMLEGGVSELVDARVANVLRMRRAGIECPITLIRPPMPSETDEIVQTCETSYNTEIDVIADLSAAALRKGKVHNIVLMVEMGDMREGIMPDDLARIASSVVEMPGVALAGIAANFACMGNVAPDAGAMSILSSLANEVEGACGPFLETVSGGSSANLPWALGLGPKGRINGLRLGEAILLGIEPISGLPIDGLHTDAFTLVTEVIESQIKNNTGPLHLIENSSSELHVVRDNLCRARLVTAIGLQDTDIHGLRFPVDIALIGATSDHMVLETKNIAIRVGDEISCQINYCALMRAMNAQDVKKIYIDEMAQNSRTLNKPSRTALTVV